MPELSYENLIAPNCEQIEQTECHVAYWIWRFVPPFLLIFGTCGNIMNIVVLSRRALRKYSTSIYLLFLAGSDMTNLLTSLLADAATAFGWFNITHLNNASCKLVEWLLYSSGLLSVWLLVFITVERLIVFKYTFSCKQKMTPTFAFVASIVLAVCVCLSTSHLLAGNQIIEIEVRNATDNQSKITREKYCTQLPDAHRVFYNQYWSLLILIFGGIVPVIIIIIGNAIIAVTIIKIRRTVLPNVQQRILAQNIYKTPTKLLFALSAMFLCTTLPFSVYLINIDYNSQVDQKTLAKYQLLTVCAYCSVWCNYSFNFLLYFMHGHLFKKEWTCIVKDVGQWFRKQCHRSTHSTIQPSITHLTVGSTVPNASQSRSTNV